jgi:putative ABC transport system permease protein
MASIVLAIRRFRDGRAAVIGLVLLVLVTAICAAAAPRLLDRAANDALRGEVRAAAALQRNIQLVQERRYETNGADLLGGVVEAGSDLEERMPADVQDLVTGRSYVIEGLRWTIENDTPDPSFLRMRIQEGIADRMSMVDGRAPTTTTRTITVDTPNAETGKIDKTDIDVVEVALSVEALQATGLAVGDTIMLQPDTTDRLVGRGGPDLPGAVDVVGSFVARDPSDPFWLDDTALFRPGIRRTGGDTQLIDVTAMLAPEEYQLLLDTPFIHPPLRYTWRYFVDPDRLQAGSAGRLIDDLRRLDGLYPSAGGNAIETGTSLRSGLLLLLQGEQARWSSAVAVLTVIGLGPVTIGAAAVALIGLFVMQRRRAALALGRARGASTGQLIGAVGLEGLALSVPPAIVAALIAAVVVPTGPTSLTVAGAATVAILTTLLLVAAGAPVAVAAPRGPGRDTTLVRRPGPRRIAIEALVVVMAIGGALLLRDRGVAGASSTGALAGADPFIAAVPALAGIAAGIVAVRLLPLPMLVLSSLAAIRRDLVPVLALRRVTRGGASGPVLIVLLATASIGTFSAATLVHLDRAAEAVAWQEVGAPYRISGNGPLPLSFDPSTLPGVEASAGATLISSVLATRYLPLTLIALDTGAYESVVGGTPGDPLLPARMLAPTIAPGRPIPAIVSPEMTVGSQGVGVGGTFSLVVEGYPLTFEVVEVRDSFPSFDAGKTFAIVSRDQLRSLRSGGGLRSTTSWYLRAPDDAGRAIRQAVGAQVSGFTVEARAERTAAIRSSPVVESLVAGVAAAAIVAFAYAALAVSAALALAGAARAVEVAHLRTLGLTRREALGLLIVEHGPTIVVAFVTGVGLGLGLFVLLRPGLGLAALTGAAIDVSVGIEPAQLLVVLTAISLIIAAGIALGAALQRGAAPAAAVRRGFE